MKQPKLSEQERAEYQLIIDLRNHAVMRIHDVMQDVGGLIDNEQAAYTFALDVTAHLLCGTARMRPGKNHTVKIAAALKDLTMLMETHRDHGDEQ